MSVVDPLKVGGAEPEELDKLRLMDVKRARAFKEMLNTEGWKQFEALMNEWINQKMTQLIAADPPQGVGSSDYLKGSVYALMLARDTPRINIAAMEQLTSTTEKDK